MIAWILAMAISTSVGAQIPGQPISDARFVDTPLLTDRFSLSMGGFLMSFDSSAAAGVGSGLGGLIDIEELLGIDPNQNVFRLDGLYRFDHHNSVAFGYWGVRRSAEGAFSATVDFLDLEFVGDYSSESTIRCYQLTYRRSLVNNGRIDAGLTFGIGTFAIGLEIEGEVEVIGDDPDNPAIEGATAIEDIIAPVPAVGLFIDYALGPRWLLRAHAAVLDLDVSDYSGRFIETRLTMDFYFSRHFGVGGGISNTDLKVSYDGEDPFLFDYNYSGFLVYLSTSF